MRCLAAALAAFIACTTPAFAQIRPLPPLIASGTTQSPVRLETADVRVETVGGEIRSTIDMVFRNPSSRVLEGNLQFPLGPDQQVVAFALDVDGAMRDAVPVEKERGRQVLEAVERRGVDPGLLEQSQGEFFRLRVYPFAPNGTRRVRVTLAEPVGNAARVVLPWSFAQGLDSVPVHVLDGTRPQASGMAREAQWRADGRAQWTLGVHRGDIAPTGSLVLTLPASTATAAHVQTWGDARYFAVDVPFSATTRKRALPSRMTLLWDSSQSGRLRAHGLELALLDAYFAAARTIDVELVRLRDVAEPPQRFAVRDGDWSALRRALETTVYDGATTARGVAAPTGAQDVLLFSDGLFNYGDEPFPTFPDGAHLFAVRAASGDAARLAALARARGGDVVTLLQAADVDSAAAQLLSERARIVRIDAVGATDVLAASPVVDGTIRLAGRLTEASPRITVVVRGPDGTSRIPVSLDGAVESTGAAAAWARYRLAELSAAPASNRAAISTLGRDFHIVTPGSSLIVLERVDDYARYGIVPPDELRADYDRLVARNDASAAQRRGKQLDEVLAQWNDRIDWWNRAFPKDTPKRLPDEAVPAPTAAPSPAVAAVAAVAAADAAATAADMAAAEAQRSERASDQAQALDSVAVTGSRINRVASASPPAALLARVAAPAQPEASIALAPWTPDSPFAREIRTLDADAAYRRYLDERSRADPGTAFYLDVADALFERKRPDLALRVLSNVAEMDLDNRHVLRVLGYRLMQAERADLAIPVLEQVLAMSADEPQSYRDLAHAYAARGDRQKAIELLWAVVTGTWDGRFPGIEVTALAELNALVATSPKPLDTHAMPAAFLRNLPLALRTVLTWDADNSDMDLWVTDPNGEKAYYGNRLTYQGGRMSPDFTGGYGPEEFALRVAKPGRYRVEANYFGDRQQVVTGATTLSLWLSTDFGTRRQNDRRVTLRLKDRKDTIFVGEFDVK